MSPTRIVVVSVTAWTVIVVAALSARALLVSLPFSPAESLIWLFLSVGPAAVFVSIYRGASSSTIAQVLYDAEHTRDKAGRARGGRS